MSHPYEGPDKGNTQRTHDGSRIKTIVFRALHPATQTAHSLRQRTLNPTSFASKSMSMFAVQLCRFR